jgi:putative SOS response-associated peptidase YedK
LAAAPASCIRADRVILRRELSRQIDMLALVARQAVKAALNEFSTSTVSPPRRCLVPAPVYYEWRERRLPRHV